MWDRGVLEKAFEKEKEEEKGVEIVMMMLYEEEQSKAYHSVSSFSLTSTCIGGNSIVKM